MTDWFASGRIIDFILGIVVLEAAMLIFTGWCGKWPDILCALLPGVFLMLAVRAALTDASWTDTALWLAAALPAHLFDMWRRRS